MEVKLPDLLGNHDRQTDQPTDRRLVCVFLCPYFHACEECKCCEKAHRKRTVHPLSQDLNFKFCRFVHKIQYKMCLANRIECPNKVAFCGKGNEEHFKYKPS